MTLDLVISQRLADPTPWELAEWRKSRGGDRLDWEQALDLATVLRWDDSCLRKVDEEERRAIPLGATIGSGPRPNVFRALFEKNVGGIVGASDIWFDAALYTIDGGSGKTGSFVDYIDSAHSAVQSTPANQVVLPAADAAFANARSAVFVAASATRYVSNRANTSFGFVTDGSGSEHWVVFRVPLNGTHVIWSYGSVSPNQQNYITATGEYVVQVTGASASNPAGTVPANTGWYASVSFSTAQTPRTQTRLKGSAGATAAGGTSANPSGTLTIGASPAGAAPADMNWRALYVFRRSTSAAHKTIIQARIQQETNITP